MAAFYIRVSIFGFALMINSTESHGCRAAEQGGAGRTCESPDFRTEGALRRRGRTLRRQVSRYRDCKTESQGDGENFPAGWGPACR